MFFDKNDLSAVILDVILLDQKNVNIFNTNRNYNALSFRISSDAVLKNADKKYRLSDNSICFVPANIESTRIAKKDKLIVIHFNSLNYSFNEIEFFSPNKPEIYAALFEQILSVWKGKEVGCKYKCTAVFNQILCECHKENYSPVSSVNPIYSSVKFIEDNFKNPNITIEEIAQKSFISTVYFRKLFKSSYGISPIQHLIRLRIECAVNLMSTGYYSLQEIAKLSGYDDYSYFSTQFKKIKGASPSNYYYNYRQ